MNVTGGSVSFDRTVNLGDYNSKKMSGKIDFTVPEGMPENDWVIKFKEAADFVLSEVESRLGLPATKRAEPAPVRTKADLEAEVMAKAAAAPALKPRRKAPAVVPVDPAEVHKAIANAVGEDPDGTGIPTFLRRTESGPVPEPTPEEWEAPSPKEVTDKDLTDACTRKTKSGTPSATIKELIAKFIKTPGTLREIPQGKRSEFLAQLEALK